VGRVPRLTIPHVESLYGLGVVPGSARARAVAATVRQIATASELSIAGDAEGPLPARTAMRAEQVEVRRLLAAFARRVAGHRPWVWYRPRGGDRFDLVALTGASPSG
jgi:hypothetical protein